MNVGLMPLLLGRNSRSLIRLKGGVELLRPLAAAPGGASQRLLKAPPADLLITAAEGLNPPWPDACPRTDRPPHHRLAVTLGPGEQLQRIAGAGAPAVVETHPGSPDGLEYRLARPTYALGACLHSYSWPTDTTR